MATDAKQLIIGWCSVTDDLQFSGERTEPGTEFVLLLTSGGSEVIASLPSDRDRLVLSQAVEVGDSGSSLAGDLPFLEEQRPGTVSVAPAGSQVLVSTWIFLDGLTKHSLFSAVSDLARTRRAVLRLAGTTPEAAAVQGAAAEAEAAPVEAVPQFAAESTEASSWAPAAFGAEAPAAEAVSPAPAAEAEVPAPAAEAATPSPATEQPVTPAAEEAPAEETAAASSATPAGGASPWASPGSGYQASPAYQPAASSPYQQAQPAQAGPYPAGGAGQPYGGAGQGYAAGQQFGGQGYAAGGQQFAAQQYGTAQGQGFGQQPYGTTPAQAPAQAAWTPGHKVPPQGMQAWAAPDPNGAVIATLGGHLPVQVTEMRGAWARVVCSNGWTGWVDGRLLVAGP
ncbi:MAG TPA: SH3 domain-containing protein [Candidatus Binatia bacterium]|nr:SH3 domain-containing protein [Candidatus Binatia bacterium]